MHRPGQVEVQVTGLKFEVGTTPTPFVEVPLVEFPRVLEYAEKSYDQGVPVGTENSTKGQVTYVAHSSAGIIAIPFGQACRTQLPLMTVYSPATGNSGMVRDTTVSSDIAAGWQNVGTSGATISFTAVPGHIYTAQWFKDCRI